MIARFARQQGLVTFEPAADIQMPADRRMR
jgi:hypothetical protein